MKKTVILLLCLCGFLKADYDQKSILLKQANNYLMQRQYEKANSIYEQILRDSPVDNTVVELYIQNLVRMSRIKAAADKLQQYRKNLPEMNYLSLHASILLGQGEIDSAKEEVLGFLSRNPGNINSYRNFSMIFEQYRQYEIAVEILEMARKAAKDDYLYARELAINYQNVKNYPAAVTEFFKLIEKQSSYMNYSLSRLRLILQEDKRVMQQIEKTASSYQDPLVIEVVAMCFAEVGDFDRALANYARLDPAKLLIFAQNMVAENELAVAEKAYRNYIEKINEPANRATAKVKLAEVLISAGQIEDAKKVLNEVRLDGEIKKSQFKYRTKASLESRTLLAQIAVRQNEPKNSVLSFLQDARNYAFNRNDISQIEFQIIRYLMLTDDFEESRLTLAGLLKSEPPGTDVFKMGYFYAFLLALMQHDPSVDSLLGEIMINMPENREVNDALLLTSLLMNLDTDARNEFLAAYRLKLLFKDEVAITKLISLSASSENEEFMILAAEWALEANDQERAIFLLSKEYQNPILSEYALLRLADVKDDAEVSRDFLQQNPQSVFSPAFRKILERL